MTESKEKIFQIFTILRHLNTPPGKTVKQLEQLLGASKSAIYRDLKILEELGYLIDTDERHRKFLQFQFSKKGDDLLDPDELFFLQEHLQQISHSTPDAHLAQSILHKFDRNLSMIPLVDVLPQFHKNRMLRILRIALNNQRCVLVKGYRSMTSNTISDRHVEPLEVTQDYRYLIGWDLNKDDQRQFKIDRIEDIDLLDQTVSPGRLHSPMDIFGLTGTDWLPAKLKLSTTAHHLLVEEFPLSRQFIRHTGQGTFFEGIVRNWKGIGRFVLGLPGEVEVINPPAFKDYLQEKIGQF